MFIHYNKSKNGCHSAIFIRINSLALVHNPMRFVKFVLNLFILHNWQTARYVIDSYRCHWAVIARTSNVKCTRSPFPSQSVNLYKYVKPYYEAMSLLTVKSECVIGDVN